MFFFESNLVFVFLTCLSVLSHVQSISSVQGSLFCAEAVPLGSQSCSCRLVLENKSPISHTIHMDLEEVGEKSFALEDIAGMMFNRFLLIATVYRL